MHVAVCLFCKDEQAYLPEWCAHYAALNFDAVLAYDNNSTAFITLRDLQFPGYVALTRWPDKEWGRQVRAYEHCLRTHGNRFDWIAFLDTDEFLMLRHTGDVKEELARYTRYNAAGVHWLQYGSSGHKTGPNPMAAYTQHSTPSLMVNRTVKSIVRPGKARGCFSTHLFDVPTVNEKGQAVQGISTWHSSDRWFIKHTWTRSEHEFRQKIRRGGGDSPAEVKGWMFRPDEKLIGSDYWNSLNKETEPSGLYPRYAHSQLSGPAEHLVPL